MVSSQYGSDIAALPTPRGAVHDVPKASAKEMKTRKVKSEYRRLWMANIVGLNYELFLI
jgi:hypothetical protein